jgi:hypothetical protein
MTSTSRLSSLPFAEASPFDSMRDHVDVVAPFERWLHENGHTYHAHCSGCEAYYRSAAATSPPAATVG